MSGKSKELKPEELKKALTEAEAKITGKLDKVDKKAVWVLLVGTTGSGKTTLMHVFADRKLICKKDSYGARVVESTEPLSDESGKFVISHKITAETYIPNIWEDTKNRIEFIDCPGFLDTAVSRRVINAFIIDAILEKANNVNILWVIDHKDLNGKALLGRDSADVLGKMLPNPRDRERAIECIVTHDDGELPPLGRLQRLADGLREERNDMIRERENTERHDRMIENLDIIIKERKAFSFPKPVKEGEFVPLSREDKKALLSSFGSFATNPEHHVVVDEATEYLIVMMGTQFADDKRRAIESLSDVMTKAIKGLEKDMDVIEKWSSRVIEMKHAAKAGWSELSEKCKAISQEDAIFIEPAKQIAKQEQWGKFTEKIQKSDGSRRIEESMKMVMDYAFKKFDMMEELLDNKKQFACGQIDESQYSKIMSIIERQMDDNRRMLEMLTKLLEEQSKGVIEKFFKAIGEGVQHFSEWLSEHAMDIFDKVKDFIL